MLKPFGSTIMNVKQPPNSGQGLSHVAFIIVDIQNDFVSGSLKVGTDSETIIQPINELRDRIPFGCVVHTQDSHPANHCSFAENNEGSVVYSTISIPTPDGTGNVMDQVMWPTHCVEGTEGWEFHPKLVVKDSDYIQKKGLRVDVDSYSGFFDNFNGTSTGLEDVLRQRGVTDVYVCGLAYDFCAGDTAIDASRLGFKTYFLEDLTCFVAEDSKAAMKTKLKTTDVIVIDVKEMEAKLSAQSISQSQAVQKASPKTNKATKSKKAYTTKGTKGTKATKN
eukprot:m.87619 g.87619  ORF g.87619 m.87619 type:complete len:279 (+) comp26095_c0_seq2:263-1099(+)